MESLSIESFKAFKDIMPLSLDQKNILLYGGNGAGKSSIYEAIKIVFFNQRIEDDRIDSMLSPADKIQAKNHLYSSFNNRQANNDFSLSINNTPYLTFDKSTYQMFMISSNDSIVKKNIDLSQLIKDSFFDLDTDIDLFLSSNYQKIQNDVNDELKSFHEDSISIHIDATNYRCTIKDSVKNLNDHINLNNIINDGKLNLIKLLLQFKIIELTQKSDDTKKILVLDDFITSLDSGNRLFLIRYIFDIFSDFQICIFTHNISFYNLIMYISKDKIYRTDKDWLYYNIYENKGIHTVFKRDAIETVKSIETAFELPASDPVDIGNRLRKKFEMSIHEISKIFMINTVDDTSKLIERIRNNKSVYIKKEVNADRIIFKSIYDLLGEIELKLETNTPSLKNDIEIIIQSYRLTPHSQISSILNNLKLYQKTILHPMSHAYNAQGIATFDSDEIKETVVLLGLLEKWTKDCGSTNNINDF